MFLVLIRVGRWSKAEVGPRGWERGRRWREKSKGEGERGWRGMEMTYGTRTETSEDGGFLERTKFLMRCQEAYHSKESPSFSRLWNVFQ
jgi:hypothetical protein